MQFGASLKRREDGRLVAGLGRYLDDLTLPDLLYLGLVRSPHAHARVLGVDRAAAAGLDGVMAVWTLDDLPELATASVPPLVPEPRGRPHRHPPLAGGRVRHAGEAVAVVVADDPYRLADAVDRVIVEYEPLPVAATPAAAMAPSAPLVHDDWPDNVPYVTRSGKGDVGPGFASAHVIVEAHLRYPRVAGMPIEPRGVLASEDKATGALLVWSSTQVPFAVRSAIAVALGLPEERIRVLVPEVGGGFGIKGHVYPEEIVVAAVARRLGRPVKWVETRREHFLSAAADRDQDHRARIGVARDGAIVALETAFTRDHGAFPAARRGHHPEHHQSPARAVSRARTIAPSGRTSSPTRPSPPRIAAPAAPRPPSSSTGCSTGRRGALGMDPAALRRLNMIRPDEMPYRSGLTYRDGVPITYDAADYVTAFDRLIERLGYADWRAEQARRTGTARPIGIGLCAYVEGTGLGPFEGADVHVDPGGTVFVHLGVCAQGQGHETTFAQICADVLSVPVESVVVKGGDTQLVGYGMGTIASRVAAVAGPAVARSAGEVADKARLVAAEMLECDPKDIVLADGRVLVKGVPGKSLRLAEVARAAVRSRALARTSGPGLSACGFFYPDSVTWAFGVQGVVVEVDVEACSLTLLRHVAMHDCGRPINPMIVEGQLHGGLAQGIGAALSRGAALRRAGPAPHRDLHGLWPAARRPDAGLRGGPSGLPLGDQPARHQGRGGKRGHRARRGHRQCRRGRAGRLRRPGEHGAAHGRADLRDAPRGGPLAPSTATVSG